jgi:hypothetical protein
VSGTAPIGPTAGAVSGAHGCEKALSTKTNVAAIRAAIEAVR